MAPGIRPEGWIFISFLFLVHTSSTQFAFKCYTEDKMSSSRKVIKFFYDVDSPYSWLAFEVLCRYKNVWNINLELKPALLAAVLQGSGNRSPVLVPNKFLYVHTDLKRVSEYFGVPMQKPSDVFDTIFGKGTLKAMRFVTAIAEKEKEKEAFVKMERVSRELWTRLWRTNQDVTLPTSLSEAGLKAGLSAKEVEELLTLATTQPIKEKLKSVTNEALQYKAFGFPTIVCHEDGKPEEVYFGADRFEVMAHRIGEKWMGPNPINPMVKM